MEHLPHENLPDSNCSDCPKSSGSSSIMREHNSMRRISRQESKHSPVVSFDPLQIPEVSESSSVGAVETSEGRAEPTGPSALHSLSRPESSSAAKATVVTNDDQLCEIMTSIPDQKDDKGKMREYEINQPGSGENFDPKPDRIMDFVSIDYSLLNSPDLILKPRSTRSAECQDPALIQPSLRSYYTGAVSQGIMKRSSRVMPMRIQTSFADKYIGDIPTSARSTGIIEHEASVWRDFAYRWPWPELPGTSSLLSPNGFGKFFAFSPQGIPVTPLQKQAPKYYPSKILSGGELKLGEQYYSDPRTANLVDDWLQCHFVNIEHKHILKEIFDDTRELDLLRDVLALIDYRRLLDKNCYRQLCTKMFIKFYCRNAEVVFTRIKKQLKYREKSIPSFAQLNDFSNWRKASLSWSDMYKWKDIFVLRHLQKDANSLARSYYNIRLEEDPYMEFILIYRAFFQLELYCQLFQMSPHPTAETTGDKLEIQKRIFFERYQPKEAELVLKISRWLVREWNTIDRLGAGHIRESVIEDMENQKVYDSNRRHFGIRFFSELLYSDLPKQIALIYRNKWQLNLIRFAWRTNCWAAQDIDENGKVLLIEDQSLINDKEPCKRNKFFGPWSRLSL